MALEVVEPRIRGFLCLTAHPAGCAREVAIQADRVRRPAGQRAGGVTLVIGGSTGYGLSSRVAGTFGHGLNSLGVFLERPAERRRTASAGWYNSVALTQLAEAEGLRALNINGDAFSDEVLEIATDTLAGELGPVDTLVYSVAAPRRTDPATGETFSSALKPVGAPVSIKDVDPRTLEVRDVEIEPATKEEIEGTIAVMGGADLARWTDALLERGLLAEGARIVAYSYIGPEVTWPIYRDGTIGLAKNDLAVTVRGLDARLRDEVRGRAHVSVNKSIVTQASAAIPGVPLYMSLLFRVMTDAGLHEGPIEQMARLFDEHIGPERVATTDAEGRIRLDDVEMRPEIQAETIGRWERVDTGNLAELADYAGYQHYFRRLFGFDSEGVDYGAPVETELDMPNLRVPAGAHG
jgi:enoyl-[acyl-carrier protein] reductase/trans-2-enoyl-CoA reductase (NAD+)